MFVKDAIYRSNHYWGVSFQNHVFSRSTLTHTHHERPTSPLYLNSRAVSTEAFVHDWGIRLQISLL